MNSSREVTLNKPIENLIASKLAKKNTEENSIHNSSLHNNSISSHGVAPVIPSNIRIKKQKPLSMNETMLNKITKDSVSIKKSNNLKDIKIPGSSTTSNHHNLNTSSSNTQNIKKEIFNINYLNNPHSNMNNSHATTLSDSFQKSNSKNRLKTSNSKSKSNFTITQSSNSMSLHKKNNSNSVGNLGLVNDKGNEIPSGKLVKVPSNGIETNNVINLNLQNDKNDKNEKYDKIEKNSHQTSNLHFNNTLSLSSLSSLSSHNIFQNKSEIFKLNEELLQLKLSNSKLTCEINILTEKIKTLKQVITMKTSENDLIKHEYTDMVDEYKREIEKMKKLNAELSQIKENSTKQSTYVKSSISVLIDLLELFVSPRNHLYPRDSSSAINRQSLQLNNSASYSIDVYDSYNNDEERRGTMVDQIQGLLIAKLNVIKKNLNIDLDREIEKVKNWTLINVNKTGSNKDDYNMMNISNLNLNAMKGRLNESESSLKKSSSNDFFDLSTSNQFINQSPKFNSLEFPEAEVKEEEGKKCLNINKDEYIMTTEGKDNQDNQILNDSFLKDLKQSNICFKEFF
jgi:hypothetical protein